MKLDLNRVLGQERTRVRKWLGIEDQKKELDRVITAIDSMIETVGLNKTAIDHLRAEIEKPVDYDMLAEKIDMRRLVIALSNNQACIDSVVEVITGNLEIDNADLARNIDYNELAHEVDYNELCSEIDPSDVANHIDLSSISDYIDVNAVAEAMEQSVADSIDSEEIAKFISKSEVADEIEVDYELLAKAFLRKFIKSEEYRNAAGKADNQHEVRS